MRSESIRLFHTLEHRCGYYGERVARNLVLDPVAPELDEVYPVALARGFRRAGNHIYRPHCHYCRACTPCRINVTQSLLSRAQKRCLLRNADLKVEIREAEFRDEYFALYQSYLKARHAGGGMDDAEPDDFSRFLLCPWSHTQLLCLVQEEQLVGVAVTDVTRLGLSAVYTFFAPELAARSLGVFAVLKQMEWAQRLGLSHLYLGYWLDGHPKMDYKRSYRPLEVFKGSGWVTLSPSEGKNP